jgi:hypothetical protein
MSGAAALTRQQAIENEQVKLLANAFNTGATSCFAIGVLAPVASVFYGLGSPARPDPGWLAAGVALWTFAAFWLHSYARGFLEDLH